MPGVEIDGGGFVREIERYDAVGAEWFSRDLRGKYPAPFASELERSQSEMAARMGVLQENKQSWQKIGELEGKVRQLELERTRLIADNDRLKADKDKEQTK